MAVHRYDRSLTQALDALEADAVMRSSFPPALCDLYLRCKRWEAEFIGKLLPNEQCRRYADSY